MHKLFLASVALAVSAHAEVTATNAWVRGMVPGQKSTAAYLTLKSSEDAKVVSVATPAAAKAQLHASMIMSGVARMEGLDALALPAGKAVELKPGAQHVMLMDMPRPLHPGDTVPLVLTIVDAKGKRSTLDVKAVVRGIAE
jgi:copper(I)-binding protein